jgi:glycyl-tRNA synthetase alpha chain
MEITQFTYFQEIGGIELNPISVEITYGLERIAMYLQQVDSVFDLRWSDGIFYRDVHHETEVQFSRYNFDRAHVETLLTLFDLHEREAKRLLDDGLVLPAYDQCMKTSHLFNVLDARGAISVTERATYIGRVRALARLCAEGWLKQREEKGFPLLHRPVTGRQTSRAKAAR